MEHRSFNAARDGANAVMAQWSRPGEQRPVVDALRAGGLSFDMPRRTRVGKLRKPTWVKVLLWIVAFPIMLVWSVMDALSGDTPDGNFLDVPDVVAFGDAPHCQAASLAGTETRGLLWARSDQRFAVMRADPVRGGEKQSMMAKAWNTAKDVGQILTSDTDQLPPEPVRLTPVLEYPYGQFSARGYVTRDLSRDYKARKAVYERVVLPDGSGFDLLRRVGG